MTRTPLKVKRSRSPGHFTHHHVGASGAAVVGIGTCWPWENTSAPMGEERGGAYRGGRPPTAGLQAG